MIRQFLWSVIAVTIAGCTTIERAALPDPTLLSPQFNTVAQTTVRTVDHSAWDGFLAHYLRTDAAGVNRLDYSRVSAADHKKLDGYLNALQQVETRALTRDQQLAFWINLYNAKTVDIVLENYPVESILKIKDGLLPTGPWNRKVVTVGGKALSLNDIEHRIIRPVFKEERIHYALNCAASACPNLSPVAWRAEGLEAALARAERAYVNDPRGVTVLEDGTLILSKIYAWFREDFGADETKIIAKLAKVAEPPLRAKLQGRTRVDRYVYDWSLNDTATGAGIAGYSPEHTASGRYAAITGTGSGHPHF